MSTAKPVSNHAVKSDLQRIDAHEISEGEYDDLPDLSDAMLEGGTVRREGHFAASNPNYPVAVQAPRATASPITLWRNR